MVFCARLQLDSTFVSVLPKKSFPLHFLFPSDSTFYIIPFTLLLTSTRCICTPLLNREYAPIAYSSMMIDGFPRFSYYVVFITHSTFITL